MAAKYRRIDPRIWDDEAFEKLDHVGMLVAFEILTYQTNRIGLFRVSYGLGADHVHVEPAQYRDSLSTVYRLLGWEFDETSRVLFIPTWWKYNPPDSWKVLVGRLKDLHDVPKTPLIERFRKNTKYLPKAMAQRFAEAFDTLSDRPYDTRNGNGNGNGNGSRNGKKKEDPPSPHRQAVGGDPRPRKAGSSSSPDSGKRSARRKGTSPRAAGRNPRSRGTNPRAAEIARRAALIAEIEKHRDAVLGDGTRIEPPGIYDATGGMMNWSSVSTVRMERIAKELGTSRDGRR